MIPIFNPFIMRRLFSVFGLVVLTALSSCAIKEEIAVESQQYPSFYATMEAAVNGATTKAYVDDKFFGFWNKNDKLSIFYANTYNKQFYYVGSSGTTSGTFKPVSETDGINAGVPIQNGLNYAIYPYDDYNACQEENGMLIVPFPKERTINTLLEREQGDIGASIMLVAKSETTQLPFQHVAGYLGFQLYGEDVSVASITMTSGNGEPFSGSANVVYDAEDNLQVSFVNRDHEDAPTCTFIYDPPIPLNASSESPKTFWITLPPTVLEAGLTLTVKDASGRKWNKESSLKEIVINQFRRFNPMQVILEAPAISVSGVELDKTALTMEVGETATLSAIVSPENATNKSVTWESSNETVATVVDGVVTAGAAGTATITVTTADGGKTATCNVTVKAPKTYGLVLSVAPAEPIKFGENVTFTVKKITYRNEVVESEESVTDAVLTIDGDVLEQVEGYVYKGIDGGTATVKASLTIDGTPYESNEVSVEVKNVVTYALAIEPAEDAEVNAGSTLDFELTLTTTTNGEPETSDVTAAATWTSSNTAVATISGGTATGVKEGNVTITVVYTNPKGDIMTITAPLKVNKKPNQGGDDIPIGGGGSF